MTEETTVVSQDHIKSLDRALAAYPFEKLEEWKSLTSHIDTACLARVIGFDSAGDARLDSLSPSSSELKTSQRPDAKPLEPKMTWGKPRPEAEDDMLPEATPAASEEVLNFAAFDLKRSWPEGAVAEDLTKHSTDKSWLLQHVAKLQLEGGAQTKLLTIMCIG